MCLTRGAPNNRRLWYNRLATGALLVLCNCIHYQLFSLTPSGAHHELLLTMIIHCLQSWQCGAVHDQRGSLWSRVVSWRPSCSCRRAHGTSILAHIYWTAWIDKQVRLITIKKNTCFHILYLFFRSVALGGKPLVLNGADYLPELNPIHQQSS